MTKQGLTIMIVETWCCRKRLSQLLCSFFYTEPSIKHVRTKPRKI